MIPIFAQTTAMKKGTLIIYVFVLINFTLSIEAQQRSAIVISDSIEPFSNSGDTYTQEFKEFLKKELEDVRIVALGESTHEDGATFEHKAELVKFLHQELGFTVLAFEYGFYGHWLINEKIRKGQDMEMAVQNAGWSDNKQSFPVYEYLFSTYQTDFPLKLAGFDGEKVPDGVPNIRSLISEIRDLVQLDISPVDSLVVDSLVTAIYSGIGNKVFNELTFEGRDRTKQRIHELRLYLKEYSESLITETGNERLLIWDFTLQSILKDEKSKYAGSFRNIVRDKTMYERVQWLADSIYKGEKIILWGASAHFARNMVQIERKLNSGDYGFYPYYQQGDWLHAYFGESFYSIAFTAGSGKTGTILPANHRYKQYEEIIDVPKPLSDSYEGIMHSSESGFLYTSLKNADYDSWLSKRFIAYPLGYNQDMANWKSVFDGFYFIREMSPVELISK